MAKSTNKTTETQNSVDDFLNAVADETKRNDSFQLKELMEKHSGFKAKMWGPAIVGFGNYHYKYVPRVRGSGKAMRHWSVSRPDQKKYLCIYTRILPTEKNYLKNLANTAPARVAYI
jgi:hypothetical protein